MPKYLLIVLLGFVACKKSTKNSAEEVCTPAAFEADGTPDANSDYLVNVFSLPQGSQSADSLVLFTLNTGSALTSALTLEHSQKLTRIIQDKQWLAKSKFERRRYQQLGDFLESATRRDALSKEFPACGECGDAAMCFHGACVTEAQVGLEDQNTLVNVVLIDVLTTDHGTFNVVLDKQNDTPAIRAKVIDTATLYSQVFSSQLNILGQIDHSGALDRNDDQRLTLIFTNQTTENITEDLVGFFDLRDFLPLTDSESSGNETDILWSRVPDTNGVTQDLVVGTLVHEYTHLSSYARRVYASSQDSQREAYWLDEGLAHLLEDTTGYGPSSIRLVEAALLDWSDGGFATVSTSVTTQAQADDDLRLRGRAFLLLRHMVDSLAACKTSDAASSETEAAARTLVSDLIQETSASKLGFLHTRFQNLGADGMWRFLMALYSTGNAEVTFESAHLFDFLPVGRSSLTGHTMGIDPHAVYVDARGETVTLTGVQFTEFTGNNSLPSDVPDSGSAFIHFADFDARATTLQTDATSLFLRHQRVQ